jgi:hypothetical protein
MNRHISDIANLLNVFLLAAAGWLYIEIERSSAHPLHQSLFLNLFSSALIAIFSYTVFRAYNRIVLTKVVAPGTLVLNYLIKKACGPTLSRTLRPFKKKFTSQLNAKVAYGRSPKRREQLKQIYGYEVAINCVSEISIKQLERQSISYGDAVNESILNAATEINTVINDNVGILSKGTLAAIRYNYQVLVEDIVSYGDNHTNIWEVSESDLDQQIIDFSDRSDAMMRNPMARDLHEVISSFCKLISTKIEAAD